MKKTTESTENQAPQIFGVQAELLKATVELLSSELPMAKARHIVEALEQSPLLNVKVEDDG